MIDTLGSQAFLSQIPNIKGMGQLSNAEGEKLQAALQNFTRKQSEKQFRDNLAEANRLLTKALNRNYEPRVAKAMPKAQSHEFDGGVSFDYNTGAIHRASWVKAWMLQDWVKVEAGLKLWNKGGGKVLPGLVRRREAEYLMIRYGAYASDKTPAKVGAYAPNAAHMNFLEVSQGFSLGINSGFYPYTTSRECTVMQALSDANIHPSMYRKSIMVVRTFPIRVAGNSGPCFHDQREMTWEELGVEPEITTVTKKIRRVFSWSDEQFMQAVMANRPDVVFLNFCNYLENLGADVDAFVQEHVMIPYMTVMRKLPDLILLGYGPKTTDVKAYFK
jgi:GH24 family phage-related lysozyme (muramidase)